MKELYASSAPGECAARACLLAHCLQERQCGHPPPPSLKQLFVLAPLPLLIFSSRHLQVSVLTPLPQLPLPAPPAAPCSRAPPPCRCPRAAASRCHRARSAARRRRSERRWGPASTPAPAPPQATAGRSHPAPRLRGTTASRRTWTSTGTGSRARARDR